MLQILQSYDGESMCLFSQKDILNIRMTMLYSWLTGGDFNIDLKDVLGVDPGMIFTFYSQIYLFFSNVLPILIHMFLDSILF
jgi:hypothetical protein